MYGYSILMLIFGICIILAGLYIRAGNNSEILLWRTHLKNPSKKELAYIGKITMIIGLAPIISSVSGVLVAEESILPIIILILSMIILLILSVKYIKK